MQDFVQVVMLLALGIVFFSCLKWLAVPWLRLREAHAEAAAGAPADDVQDDTQEDITSSEELEALFASFVLADQDAEDGTDGQTDESEDSEDSAEDAQPSDDLLWLLARVRASGCGREEARPRLARLGHRFSNALWTQAGRQVLAEQPAQAAEAELVPAPWSDRLIDPSRYASAMPAATDALPSPASVAGADDKEASVVCHATKENDHV